MTTSGKKGLFAGAHSIVKTDYIGRITYNLLGALIYSTTFYDYGVEKVYYVIFIGYCLISPHLYFLASRFSKDQKRFELRYPLNMDPFPFGFFIPLLQFNPILISFIVVAISSVGIVAGGIRLLLSRCVSFCIGLGIGTLLFGFRFNPDISPLTTIILGFNLFMFVFTSNFISYYANIALTRTKKELKEQKALLEALSAKLSKYLSPQIYNSIFTGKSDVRIGSSRKKLTVFFSDIQGFTETTDRMEAEDLSALLNSYLDEMTKIALRHGGTVDKYIGDAIMVFFGDPETRGEKEDALHCVSMALEMRERLEELRKDWTHQGVANPLNVRMGINTGFCTVGNFGSEERLDYTIIGGQVNLASRLQSSARPNQILVSRETQLLIDDQVACGEAGEVQVKGISRPVMTFEVIGFRNSITGHAKSIRKEADGISVNVDLNRIEQEKALDILNGIIEEIRERRA